MENKNFENEVMSDVELDNVAGGTYIESFNVASFLYQAGFDGALNEKGVVNFSGMRSALNSIGISVEDHGGVVRHSAHKVTFTPTLQPVKK